MKPEIKAALISVNKDLQQLDELIAILSGATDLDVKRRGPVILALKAAQRYCRRAIKLVGSSASSSIDWPEGTRRWPPAS
jgi:hypothetical protein